MELVEEVKRWLTQALRDLKAARDSLRNSNYEWA
ncbi:MAG: DNA-binding protein, partial [Thermoprotei archaeon]